MCPWETEQRIVARNVRHNPAFVPVLEGLQANFPLIPGLGDGGEVRTRPALYDDLACDAVFVEAKMPLRLLKGATEDLVFNVHLLPHAGPFRKPAVALAARHDGARQPINA